MTAAGVWKDAGSIARRLYDGDVTDNAPPRAFSATTALSIAGGAALFALVIWKVGPAEIAEGFRRLGWGIAAVVALGGFRFAARAAAWIACMDTPHVLPFPTAFACSGGRRHARQRDATRSGGR